MESIKCSAKDIDIYIFLPMLSVLELADLSHSYSSKDFPRPRVDIVPHTNPHHPSLESSTHNFFVTPLAPVTSSEAAVAESTGRPIASEPHHREDGQPHHFSYVSFGKLPLLHAHFYMLQG